MTDLEKAARMALEALEYYQHRKIEWDYSDDAAITALRQALEQPAQQEPVAWKHPVTADVFSTYAMAKKACCVGQEPIPLYTSPQRKPWVGLAPEEREMHIRYGSTLEDIAISIEAKLKEKNA
jgi:hypothetical protein